MVKPIKDVLAEVRAHEDYREHWIVSDFTEELCRRMDVLGLTRRAFADKIDSSPAYVTKVLGGEENLTCNTMAKLAMAVGSIVRVHLAPVGTYTVWLDMGDSGAAKPVSTANLNGVAFAHTSATVSAQIATATSSGVTK